MATSSSNYAKKIVKYLTYHLKTYVVFLDFLFDSLVCALIYCCEVEIVGIGRHQHAIFVAVGLYCIVLYVLLTVHHGVYKIILVYKYFC